MDDLLPKESKGVVAGAAAACLVVLGLLATQLASRSPRVTQKELENTLLPVQREVDYARGDVEICAATLKELIEALPKDLPVKPTLRTSLSMRIYDLETILHRQR